MVLQELPVNLAKTANRGRQVILVSVVSQVRLDSRDTQVATVSKDEAPQVHQARQDFKGLRATLV